MLGEQFMVGSEVCGAVISVRFQVHVILQAFQSNHNFNEDCLEVTTEKVSCCLPIAKQPPLHHSHVGVFQMILSCVTHLQRNVQC